MGIDRMGYVNLSLECPSETLSVNSNFSKADAKEKPTEWIQNYPELEKGVFYTVGAGMVKLTCPFSDVHFMAPTFPVAHGKKVVFEFVTSGKEEGGVGLYLYTIYDPKQCGRWHTAQKNPCQVDNGGQKRIRLEVDTGKLSNRFRDVIGSHPYLMSRNGAKIIFSVLKISRESRIEKKRRMKMFCKYKIWCSPYSDFAPFSESDLKEKTEVDNFKKISASSNGKAKMTNSKKLWDGSEKIMDSGVNRNKNGTTDERKVK